MLLNRRIDGDNSTSSTGPFTFHRLAGLETRNE